MKRVIASLLILIMLLSMTIALGSCKKNESEMGLATENTVDKEEEKTKKPKEDKKETEEAEPAKINERDIEKSFEPDAEGVIGKDLPMQIEKVALLKDSSVVLIPTDKLKENELGESKATSLMPFADSGEDDAKIKDIYLLKIGNAGNRTILALLDDGTISAINTRALIEDHIIAVMDNVGGRDTFTSIEQEKDEEEGSFSIIGMTEDGEEVTLDPVLLVEDGEEVRPAN